MVGMLLCSLVAGAFAALVLRKGDRSLVLLWPLLLGVAVLLFVIGEFRRPAPAGENPSFVSTGEAAEDLERLGTGRKHGAAHKRPAGRQAAPSQGRCSAG